LTTKAAILITKAHSTVGSHRIHCFSKKEIKVYEELNDLYSSPTIVRVIKSRRMGYVGHVVGWGGEQRVQGFGGETWGKEITGETQV
jgi:hypothetical protein